MENEKNERVRWFEKSPGNTSMMRIAAMVSMVTGTLIALTAVALVIIIAITSNELLTGLVNPLLTSAPIIMGVSQVSKGIQANSENRNK